MIDTAKNGGIVGGEALHKAAVYPVAGRSVVLLIDARVS